jgi:hypothetical protein
MFLASLSSLGLTHKLERLARDKCSILLQKGVTYGCKMFYNTGPRGANVKNLS